MLELRAVGGMQIDVENRIPFVEQPQQRLHLGRIGFRVVAIEVQILRGRTPTHLLRPDLIRTVPPPEAFVAVGIQYGDEHERRMLESAFGRTPLQHFAQCEEPCVLAVDLTRVNRTLHHDDWVAALLRGRGVENTGGGGNQRMHRTAFRRTSELQASNRLAPSLLERCAQALHFLVAPRSSITRPLAERRKRSVGRARTVGDERAEQKWNDVAQSASHRMEPP